MITKPKYSNRAATHLYWLCFRKFIPAILLPLALVSCGRKENTIEGTWTFMKAADKGKDATVTMKAGHQQLQFLETGEVRQYYDHKRFGLGLCYYRLKDDSLQLTWVQKDDSGRLDTFQMERLRISI